MPPDDPTPKDTTTSAALVIATSRALARACPSMSAEERAARAEQVVRLGYVFMKGDMSIGVKEGFQDLVREAAPGLLQPDPGDLSPRQKRVLRMKETERVLGARLEASRQPKTTQAEEVAVAVAAAVRADPRLQGFSHSAKQARAQLRALKWREIGGIE